MISFRVKFTLLLLYFLSGVCPSYGEVLQVDNNFDGKMDQWHHMSGDNKIIKIDDIEGKIYELENWKPSHSDSARNYFLEKIHFPDL